MYTLTLLAALASIAASLTDPPRGALVVGDNEKYTNISQAIAALSPDTLEEQIIFVQPGVYYGQIRFPRRMVMGPVTVYGASAYPGTYQYNQVEFIAGESQESKGGNDQSATLSVHIPFFKMYNCNITNTRGKGNQAVALSAYGPNAGFYGVALKGYQDTLLAEKGVQIYANTYIDGATDFIFGQDGRVWFHRCDIRVLHAKQGYITASGRNSEDSLSYYVFNNSTVDAAPGEDVKPGSYVMGRPWQAYARVIYQWTYLSEVINPKGWGPWGATTPNTEHVEYHEYKNYGPGSKMDQRDNFGTKAELDEPVSVIAVLGANYSTWVDSMYFS